MKHLRLYMMLFGVLLTLPLGFVAWRTYVALDREAESQARFFAGQLLDGMEAELTDLVRREEGRAVDAYGPESIVDGKRVPSTLSGMPAEPFILGYFQNNPDGSFQTPMRIDPAGEGNEANRRVGQLRAINRAFNTRKQIARLPAAPPPKTALQSLSALKSPSAFTERYLNAPTAKKSKRVLGQAESRLEEITAGQAMQLASKSTPRPAVAAPSVAVRSRPRRWPRPAMERPKRCGRLRPACQTGLTANAHPKHRSPDRTGAEGMTGFRWRWRPCRP